MGWPQYTYLALLSFGIVGIFLRARDDEVTAFRAVTEMFTTTLFLFLLYAGGFFG